MKRITTKNLTSLNLTLAALALVHGTDTVAATRLYIPTPSGYSCDVIDINNDGRATGDCKTVQGNSRVWMAEKFGALVLLPALPDGKDCKVLAIGNDGTISGNCHDSDGVAFGTLWNPPYTVATKLAPLRGLFQDPANPDDVSTKAVANNNLGFVVGQSIDKNGRSTATMWTPGNPASPMTVSTPRDDCQSAAINDELAPDAPRVALNCNDASGQSIAKVAHKDYSGFIAVNLIVPENFSSCQVRAVNNSNRYVGGCNSAHNKTMVTFWNSPNQNPDVLDLHSFTSSVLGVAVNSRGNIAFEYRDLGGTLNPGYWGPSGYLNLIAVPEKQTYGRVRRLSDDNVLLLNKENDGADVAGNIVPPSPIEVTFVGGGRHSRLNAISSNGAFMAEMQ